MSSRLRSSAILGLVDQVLSSLQNVAVVLLCAQRSSAVELGAVSLSLAVVSVAVGLVQAVLGEPLLLHAPRVSNPDRLTAAAAGYAPVLALFGSAVLFLVGSQSGTVYLRADFFASAFMLPGLVCLDVVRFGAFARGHTERALILDGIWIGIWLLAEIIMPSHGATMTFLLWGASSYAALAIFFALRLATVTLRLSDLTNLLASVRRDAASLTTEFVSLAGAAQLFSIAIAAILGLEATAGLRVVATLFGPLNTLTNAIRAVLIPHFVAARSDFARLRRWGLMVSLVCVVITGISMVVALCLPMKWGSALFGASWALAIPLLIPSGAQRLLSAVGIGALNVARAVGAVRKTVLIRGTSTIAGYLIAVLVAYFGDLSAALWVTAIGGAVSSLLLWRLTPGDKLLT